MNELDLSAAVPYMRALETAHNFPTLFLYASEHDEPHLIDKAMEEINKWCPHLWPYIDRAVLRIVDA